MPPVWSGRLRCPTWLALEGTAGLAAEVSSRLSAGLAGRFPAGFAKGLSTGFGERLLAELATMFTTGLSVAGAVARRWPKGRALLRTLTL